MHSSEPKPVVIFHTDLNNSPVFEALSYNWGADDTLNTICFTYDDAPTHKVTFRVTRNPHAALQDLRFNDRSRVLWTDAICINQNDNAEKTEQVRQMRSIYLSANGVVVWLGEKGDAEIAIDFCETLAISGKEDNTSFYSRKTENGGKIGTDKEREAARKLFFERPWYSRSWVLQEVMHLGKVTVYIGTYSKSTEELLSSFEKYYNLRIVAQSQVSVGHLGRYESSTSAIQKSCSMKCGFVSQNRQR